MFSTTLVPTPLTLAPDHSASRIATRKTRLAKQQLVTDLHESSFHTVDDSIAVHCSSSSNVFNIGDSSNHVQAGIALRLDLV